MTNGDELRRLRTGIWGGQRMAILKILYMHPYQMTDSILNQEYMQHVPEEQHEYSCTYQWLKRTCYRWQEMTRRNWDIFHRSFPWHTMAMEWKCENADRAAQLAILYEATRLMYFENTEDALRDFDDAVKRGIIDDPTQAKGWDEGFIATDLSLGNGPLGTLCDIVERVRDYLERKAALGDLTIGDAGWIDFQCFEQIREAGVAPHEGIPWRGENLLLAQAVLRNEYNYQIRRLLVSERKQWKD